MKLKMTKKQIILGSIVLLLVFVFIFSWVKWISPTKIAFLNYQPIELGQIAKANTNGFIKIKELSTDDIDDVGDYDMVFINGMGLRITEEQRTIIRKAAENGTPVLTTMATNPDNNICSVDSLMVNDLKEYLSGGRANYRNLLEYVRTYIDCKAMFTNEPEEPVESQSYLLSHPDVDDPDAEEIGFNTLREYKTYLKSRNLIADNAPNIIITGQMGEPSELIAALEKSGNNVYRVWNMRKFINDGHADSISVAAVINMAHGRMGDYMVEYLSENNVPLFCPVNANQLQEDWEADKMGMNGGFLSQSVVTPEIDGGIRPYALFAHYENDEGIREVKAIPGRLDTFVETVNNHISLKRTPNKDKKIAIVYYKGPGVSAMSAAGMDVGPSLYNLLLRLGKEGYYLKNLPSSPAELEKMVQADRRILFGNVAIVPQPLPNQGENSFKIIHGTDQDPEESYISTYKWISDTLKADALIHFGTHGSLEFTPRKQVALCSQDWPDRLVGPLPHFYIYSIADVGEGMIAKRRSYAALQSYLTPPFLESNLRGEYKGLMDKVEVYFKNPSQATSLDVKKKAVELGLHRDLELDSILSTPYTEDDILRIENFAEEIAAEKITGQLYVMGVPYEDARIGTSVFAMSVDPIAYSLLALDKLRNPAKAKKTERKGLFNRLYLEPAKSIVAAKLNSGHPVSDSEICDIAGISSEELNEAREIVSMKDAPQRMMEMMMSRAMPERKEGSKTNNGNIVKAMATAKKMGASDEQLEKMKKAMLAKREKTSQSGNAVGKKSNPHADMKMKMPEYTPEQKAKAAAIMEVERTLKNISNYSDVLRQSPEMELTSLINALAGGYVKPSPGGDPIANPNSLPTGRNLFGINAEATPSESAWNKGVEMAKNTIDMYRKRHNDSIPRKVSYTLWSGEFIESEGATIAQVLYMLGVEPVRDAFGRVTDLRLIPSDELGRPRIDVVVQTSGQLRDIAASRLFLINRAVEMAAASKDDNYENQVAQGITDSERKLVERGISPKEARAIAAYRVFGGLNGGYGTGIQGMVQGNQWKEESEIADTYLNNMGAYYGDEDNWEAFTQYAFEAALTNTDAVIQPRQSNTWGTLSLDHVYEFMGGMNLAVRNVTGKDPDAYLSDYRNRSNYRMQEVKEAIGVEGRSTIFNPTYIKEKMKGGAGDASTFAEIVQNTYGWNVMKPAAIDPEMWSEIYEVYVNDKHNLGIREFFKDKNPSAMQQMTTVMKEAAERGYWKPDAGQINNLENLNQEMSATISSASEQSADDGMVMKKEEMNNVEHATVGNVGKVAVAVAVAALIILLVVVAKRRRNSAKDME